MSTPSLNVTKVDLSGLLTVLGQHLYSTPAVALRELAQNGHDSITRRRMEDPAFSSGAIRVWAENGDTVIIEDDGAGLTEPEIHSYLATLGAGYTRLLREKTSDDKLIGMFGLGFISAFVLADTVSVITTSFQRPHETWHYRSNGGQRYSVEAAESRPIGTCVTLSLRDQFTDLAQNAHLEYILARYCVLLSHPIHVGGQTQPINHEPPPWRLPHGEEPVVRMRRRKLDFASRFETAFEPICTMDVLADAQAGVHGMLWVQDGGSYATSDNRNLSVFVRGMLLDDDARDLLPVWAGFIGGVIEADLLTPTASREDLQRDEQYGRVQAALEEAVIVGLQHVRRQQPEAWQRILARHNEALMGAALCNHRLFDLLADAVHVASSMGDHYAGDLVSNGRIYVSLGSGGFEEMLFRAQQIAVARGDRYAVLPFLKRWCEERGQRLIQIGTATGDSSLFKPASLPEPVQAWLGEHLLDEGEELVVVSFAPESMPFVLVTDREAELKRRLESDEANKRFAEAALRLARMHTSKHDGSIIARLYLNANCPAVKALVAAHAAAPESALAMRAQSVLAILSAFKTVMAPDPELSKRDAGAAFRSMAAAIEALLQTEH